MSLKDHKAKCRLCIVDTRMSFKITETEQKKFFRLTNIELKSSDKFSNSICRKCMKSLNDSYEFQQTMFDNQQRLYAFEGNIIKQLVKEEPTEVKTVQLLELEDLLPKTEVFASTFEEELVTPEQDEMSRSESTEDLKTSHQDADLEISGDDIWPDPKAGKKRRNCSDELKGKALKAVASGEMSVLEASRHFQVPNTSLRKKFNALLPEKKIFLTEDEEVQVRIFIKNRSEAEMQTTNKDIINCTTRILRQRKKGYIVATSALWSSWVEAFRSRYANYSESQSYEGLVYVCDLCNFTARKKKDLRVHMNSHADNRRKRGPRGEARKSSKSDLEEAVRLVSEGSMTKSAAARIFGIARTTLCRHLKNKEESHESKIRKCSYCERVFHNDSSLRSHIKKHLEPEGEFKCEECGKVFLTRLRLQNHKIFHKRGVFRCSMCDLVFDRLLDAQMHNRSHRPLRACEICGKMVLKGASYTKHLRTHGEPKFKCSSEGCSKAFHQNSDLEYHNRNAHGPKKSIKCPKCSSTFSNKTKLKFHDARSHSETEFFCMVEGCSYKNALKEYLRVHLRKHKNIDVKHRDELIADLKDMKG